MSTRQQRKASRQEARQERRLARVNRRSDIVDTRQTNRTERNLAKFSSFEVAYANGIDPRKGMLEGVASVVSSGAQVVGAATGNNTLINPNALIAQPQNSNVIIYVLVAIVAFFLFKR
jgi:hypothetical protein